MELSNEIRSVKEALQQAEAEKHKWAARADGLRAELAALQRAAEMQSPSTTPDDGYRTDDIVSVLQEAGAPLRIRSIIERLEARGRADEKYHVVAATLQMLLGQKRVRRVGRGLYEAA